MTGSTVEQKARAIGRFVRREELDAEERRDMYALMAQHFSGITPQAFSRDLEAKNWVVLIEDASGLCGFSTLHVYDTVAVGSPITVVYSGDTIMRKDTWGTTAFLATWIQSVFRLRDESRRRRWYWLLLSSGYRTYRLLSLWFHQFYPRYDQVTPPEWQARLNQLAEARFGSDYNRRTGIVQFSQFAYCLRDGIGSVTPLRCRNPHVGFFIAKNPGHLRGDELVCLAEINYQNLSHGGWRLLRASDSAKDMMTIQTTHHVEQLVGSS